jgi:hypothetical protein
MGPVDYRELALANRDNRIRHIEALRVLVQANQYRVSSDDIADGIIDESIRPPRPRPEHH